MKRINVKQAVPFCLKLYWRPKSFGVEQEMDGYWVPVVVWVTENGQEKRLYDSRGFLDRDSAADYAEELLRYAQGTNIVVAGDAE